jgi:hypothetical protein
MAQKKVEHTADKGSHLTLDEVAAWVQDAMRSGASGDSPVVVRAGFSGKLQKISVDVEQVRMAKDSAP